MEAIAQIFANNAVPTAIIIVMLFGVFRPPRWVVRHIARRTEAYEKSQSLIANSVAGMANTYSATQQSTKRIETLCEELVSLRRSDNERHAEAVHECRLLAHSCERMADTIEPRREVWTTEERTRRQGVKDGN